MPPDVSARALDGLLVAPPPHQLVGLGVLVLDAPPVAGAHPERHPAMDRGNEFTPPFGTIGHRHIAAAVCVKCVHCGPHSPGSRRQDSAGACTSGALSVSPCPVVGRAGTLRE